MTFKADSARWLQYVRESILEPAIGRDIMALQEIRKPALLRQAFLMAATIPAQIISLQKLQSQLQDKGALTTLSHYLEVLEHVFLIATMHKFTQQPIRLRESPPKVIVLNHAICAAMDPRGVPDRNIEPERYGFWVENACLALMWNMGLRPMYWREEPYEVDAVLLDGHSKWAIEIKTGDFGRSDLNGLFEFVRRNPEFKPFVLCDEKYMSTAARLGLHGVSWRKFLFTGELS